MLKTYTREELKQLEGKRVRAFFQGNCYTTNHTGIVSFVYTFTDEPFMRLGFQYVFYEPEIKKRQFELLENEFEVGELVEVRNEDEDKPERGTGRHIHTRPGKKLYKYACLTNETEYKCYLNGENFLYEDFHEIRKLQTKPEPLEQTMEDINKKYGCEVKIVEKK